MFVKGYTLFRLFGFDVKVDPTWIILAILVTWTLAEGVFPFSYPGLATEVYWWMGVAGMVGLFFSIVFHEFSHSLVARRHGMRIQGITLFIFGGVAQMEEEPPAARTEFLMAAAGPLASLVLALGFYGAFRLSETALWAAAVTGVLFYLGYLNALLAIFNLIPAFPLDGGRMLRATLWGWKGDLKRATRLAAGIGSGFGLLLIFLGVLTVVRGNFVGGMWWFLIGMFLRNAADASYRQVLVRDTLKDQSVRAVMNSSPIVVPPAITLDELAENFVYAHHHKMFPVVEEEVLFGCVGTAQLKAVARQEWGFRTVEEVLQPCTADNSIAADADVTQALTMMRRTDNSRLMVVEKGRLVGIIALKDLMRFISVKLETVG